MIDVAPTILEVAGLPEPTVRQRHPADAAARASSMRLRFDDADAPETHAAQYFEMFCNRGIYHKGWTAVTRHSTPWVVGRRCRRSTTTSGSSTTPDDWTQAHDLAAEQPEKLAELQRLWLIEAVKYNVLPLDDRGIERFNSDIAGRPAARQGQHARCSSAACAVSENSRAQPQEQVALGHRRDRRARRRRRRRDHRPGRRVRRLEPLPPRGQARSTATTSSASSASTSKPTRADPAGKHQVRMEFAYDGGGLAKGGDVTLYFDGKKVGDGRVDAHRADDLLRRRDLRRRLRHRHAGTPDYGPQRQQVHRRRSTGCRSTSATTATTTSSDRRTGSRRDGQAITLRL